MRKPNSTFLWMLTFILFVPLAALAQDPATPKPTLTIDQMTPAQRQAFLTKLEADEAKIKDAAFTNTLATTPDAAGLAALRQKVAADRATTEQAAAQKTQTETTAREEERARARAGMNIPTEVASWDALKKLIPDVKLVYDRAAGNKDYAASVHLEGYIPRDCVAMIGTPNAGGTEPEKQLLSKYTGSPKIESLSKGDVPFRGWNFRTSEAAQECVDQFLKDKRERKASGICKTDRTPMGTRECFSLRDVTKIDDLVGGPKVGFYTCDADGGDCKAEFYADAKSESDVKRVADSTTFNDARRRVDTSLNARRTNLQLWKIKNVDQCYGYGKKMSLSDFFTDVAAVKAKLKDREDLSPYVKKGLNNEIARLRQLAESGKKVSDLPAFASEVAAFYTKYLATSRSDVPNPDLDLMRRATLGLFKTMERRVLDDDSALRNPTAARDNAEAIISTAISLAPDDINLKNELEAGIKIDVTVLNLERKQVAFEKMKQQCQQNPGNCDQQRLYSMYVGLVKAQQSAAGYYQKLQISAAKQCASGRKRSADPFDDEGLIVDGSDDSDDEVTFKSRCDAAKDNLNRVWRRVQDSNTAVQNAAGPDPRIVSQLAQGITGGNALPNATITPGQNGYNPALAFALNPSTFPGNFSSDFLRSLAPSFQPTTALGSNQMCLTGVGQTSNCFATGNGIMVNGSNMPAALPRPI